MKVYKTFLTLLFTMLLMVSFSAAVLSLTRDELGKYKEEVIMAPDFALKAVDGKVYKLGDFRDKKFVVIQTGSST